MQDIAAYIFACLLLIGFVIFHRIRTRRLLERQQETNDRKAEMAGQLAHAAKLAAVGELAAGIAHEVNNPLAIITEKVGLIQDLKDPRWGKELSDEELFEHLQDVNEAAFRARDITRKLLAFVRQTEVKREVCAVEEIIDEVVDDLLGSELQTSRIALVKEYGGAVPRVHVDRNLLLQVVLNLAKNAFDAMDVTNQPGTLTVRTKGTGDGDVEVVVDDTGCGIPEEKLQHVFLPFFTTKEVGRGTGLGLSVSKGIIEGMGGTIAVRSTAGEGTTFTVALPAHQKSAT